MHICKHFKGRRKNHKTVFCKHNVEKSNSPATVVMIIAMNNLVVVDLKGMIVRMPEIAHKIRAIVLIICNASISSET